MSQQDIPLDADEVMIFAERIAQLPPDDAGWVGHLLRELLRARRREAELLAGQAANGHEMPRQEDTLNDQLAQVALDTAAWLRTLWDVGYMGAGNFRSEPRSSFPSIDIEDVRKSSLFARIRQGKQALPFPPPTRHGLPWHGLLEDPEQTQQVDAEIIRDESGRPFAAIIECCAEWDILEETLAGQEFIVQHQGKGPTYRLRLDEGMAGELRPQAPSSTCTIRQQERGGFHSYTLEWPLQDGRMQLVALRAATWERAESEAQGWLATNHPELYGQIRFERADAC